LKVPFQVPDNQSGLTSFSQPKSTKSKGSKIFIFIIFYFFDYRERLDVRIAAVRWL
jgi:hypothetical protein